VAEGWTTERRSDDPVAEARERGPQLVDARPDAEHMGLSDL
jgi:hypothetical protein